MTRAIEVSLPYGEDMISAKLPEEKIIFRGEMNELPPMPDMEAAIARVLENPIGGEPLSSLLRGKKNIAVIIEDYTRHTPLDRILPVLIGFMNEHGVAGERVSFLTAPGTHRAMTSREVEKKIGAEMARRFRVVHHDANDAGALRDLGTMRAGGIDIPALVNAYALEADLLIGLGCIVPHPDAGFSGGAKIVQPGICGAATTAATHLAAGLMDVIPLGDVNTPGRLAMEAVAAKAGLRFILNTVQNKSGEVVALVAGDPVSAHRAGAEVARRNYAAPIPERADIVVASSSPCDADFWQASKGLISASFAVRRGGIVVLAAPCPEGMAETHPGLVEWLEMTHADASRKARETDPNADIDFVAADVALNNSKIREFCRIFIVSGGLRASDARSLGHTKFATLQEAADEALRLIPDAMIGILPHAGITLCVETSHA